VADCPDAGTVSARATGRVGSKFLVTVGSKSLMVVQEGALEAGVAQYICALGLWPRLVLDSP